MVRNPQEQDALNQALGQGGGTNGQFQGAAQNAPGLQGTNQGQFAGAAAKGQSQGQSQGALPPSAAGRVSAQGLGMEGLNGFDQGNFYNPEMQSVKYRFARLAQKAGARTPQQMSALVLSPEFQKEFPGSTFNGKDWLNFNGALSDFDHGTPVGGVDVLLGADAASNTANGIAWMPEEQQAVSQALGGGRGRNGGMNSWNPLMLIQQGLNEGLTLQDLLAQFGQNQKSGGYY